MSTSAKYPVPGSDHPRPDPAWPGHSLYQPAWWERRFPWLLDLLAALDPAPLARRFGRALAPVRNAIERLIEPLAVGLDAVAGVGAAARSAALEALSPRLVALPLPEVVRRWVWLRPQGPGRPPAWSEQLTLWTDDPRVSDTAENAQARLRRQYSVILPLSLMVAVAAHAGVLLLSPALGVTDAAVASNELQAIELPPDVSLPEPPRPIARPATPVLAAADVDEDITISPTSFDDYAPADLPPPPPERAIEVIDGPTFTPFTVAPRILNADFLEELMAQEYPPLLLESKIGGVVVIWAFINRDGVVEDIRLAKSSGYEGLDAAALRVGARIRTSPALNRDRTVPVWIQVPLEFEVR